MNGDGKSDGSVVPQRPANRRPGESGRAERAEGRDPAKGNPSQSHSLRTQRRERLHHAVARIRQTARERKGERFTALWHHVYDVDRLREAYLGIQRESAPGVDGTTWRQYGEGLEDRLQDLSERLRRGAYRAKPVRRVYIPKADGRQRPIGVPALEDKIVQRAAAEVIGAVYEADFLGFSYGFRPSRSQHDALDAVTVGLERRKVSWVLDVDIRGFFDTIDHGWLLKFIEHRIADPRVHRHVKKWLDAGVEERGVRREVERGTPQGGSISPLLSNVYLHYVLDLWADRWRKRHATGDVIIVRYADDVVMGFQRKGDAERFRRELAERFRTFGLELHPEKTRLIEFGRSADEDRRNRGDGKPETFNFLGFTHICARTRKGRFRVLRQTMRQRLTARLKAVHESLRRRMHEPVARVGAWIRHVVNGYYQYHAVPGNSPALRTFHHEVTRTWLRVLRRRSQTHRLPWKRYLTLANRWIPRPRILHPYPSQRLCVTT
jgi:RNA-directed DNA polymerase